MVAAGGYWLLMRKLPQEVAPVRDAVVAGAEAEEPGVKSAQATSA
jgi:hypothetical protein